MINRIIAPILIKDGFLVQSKKYNWHLPIGQIEESASQLQYFNIDEFLLISLDGMTKSRVDVESLTRLRKVVSHPISYAGGVINLKELKKAFDFGADRIVLNRLLDKSLSDVEKFVNLVGRQGVVGSIDIMIDSNGGCFFRTIDRKMPLNMKNLVNISSIVGEINLGLIDLEGTFEGNLNEKILKVLLSIIENINCPITIYGGSSWFNYHDLSNDQNHKISVLVDNILSYKEDSVYGFKEKLKSM